MSRRPNSSPISDEPPCWGSGECELVPVALHATLKGVPIAGLVYQTDTKSSDLIPDFSIVTSPLWTRMFDKCAVEDQTSNLVDLVVESLERVFAEESDRLDVPILLSPLDRFDNALLLPLEVRTWDFLLASGVVSNHDVCTLLTSTFREIVQRLNDMRAAIDLAVTGSVWISPTANGAYGFSVPKKPASVDEAVQLARLRTFRMRGWPPSSVQYTAEFADVIGKRWSIGLSRAWSFRECGEAVGLTAERVRRVEQTVLWESAPRLWGRPNVLDPIYEQLVDFSKTSITTQEGQSFDRRTATDLMIRFGYPEDAFEAPWSASDEVGRHGLKWSQVVRVAYGESEKLGFITEFELRHHIAEQFPDLVGEMFDEVISQLIMFRGLPHGYVYLESQNSSYVKSWLLKIFGVLGPQSFEEAYKALVRFCTVRAPRQVFPPRPVIKDFIERHQMFWISDDLVGLQEPFEHEIDGVQNWLRTQIESCTGNVIHKTELWDRARRDGIRVGTLNVYTLYHLLFKPCGLGCITITGHHPSSAAIELARIRARAIRVPSRRGPIRVVDGIVSMSIEVGNDLLDTGVMSTTKELRTMIQDQRFAIMAKNEQFGNVGWSKGSMTGYSTVLQDMDVQPGDSVLFSFDVTTSEVSVSYDVK